MPIPARVVPDARVPALVAPLDMAAERGGPTLLDRRHDAPLRGRQRGSGLVTIDIAVAAEHVRHGEPWAIHTRRRQRAEVFADVETGRGSRSRGLVAEQTFVVASRR